ncbi:hypothetical protein P152DRAFT_475306 [Eremomyces bilateralis CBS 781.70]|uniref:Clock-controlled protein 6 n=1 Tax=Eremomyces bilateralis CBS 781.70 TaxID=1392243 RepID=A0A6G1FYS1_9PEZI|nr:uncharacterized protein P152DRAFT_475306 [Eremomyces bilateralis CBS 781.70]KAF1810851.1 hypothetical protein P152DRAFT_475306 [Eremomyces bilateralis CBS 781.70]
MRFSTIAAATLLAVGVSAGGRNGTAPPVVTEVVTDYVTYCPAPTTITHGGNTYTITEATTITLPCPTGCTVTKPVSSAVVTKCTTCEKPPPAPTSKPYGNGTTPAPTKSSPSVAPPAKTSAVPPKFTGAASQMAVSGGALAAIFGMAAYLL